VFPKVHRMRITELAGEKRVILEPGEYYVTKDNAVLSTLLGSCVSVCLYDPIRRVAGMNHFLLSSRRYARNRPVCLSEAGRYGVHSMELLINSMMEMGADRRNLLAKAFGGGSILPRSEDIGNFHCVGSVNSKFIREFLANEQIPLMAEELEGDRGRVIYFRPQEYSVYVRPIHAARSIEVAIRDKQWWQESLQRQERTVSRPDIWT
jgi:chemotaxis protein CheD